MTSLPSTALERLASLLQSLAALVAQDADRMAICKQARVISDEAAQIVFELQQPAERNNGA